MSDWSSGIHFSIYRERAGKLQGEKQIARGLDSLKGIKQVIVELKLRTWAYQRHANFRSLIIILLMASSTYERV